MNATRILPDLQCSLVCEDVRPEANGNFILVGVIGFIRVPQVPVTAFLDNRLEWKEQTSQQPVPRGQQP